MASDDRAPSGAAARGLATRPVAAALVALAAYAALVAGLTWPLLPNATTHIPATYGRFHFDTLHTAWMLSHESRALAAPSSLLDAGIYHPAPRTLFYSTLSAGLLPYFAPTFLLTGNPTLALDLAFLVCAALTAWTIHLVVWRWTGDHLAATAGGVTFLLSRTTLWGFVSCATYYAPMQYFPLILFAAATPASALAASALLPVLIALQCLVDPLYVAPAVLGPLGAIALWRIARPPTRADGLRLLRALCLGALVLIPIFAGYLELLHREPNLRAHSLFKRVTGAVPPSESGGSAGPGLPFWLLVEGHFLGWQMRFTLPLQALAVTALGAAAAIVRRRGGELRAAWLHGAFWTVFALVVPFASYLSTTLRGMPRAGLVGLVALALLSGLAVAECSRWFLDRLGRPARTLVVIVFLGTLFWTLPGGMFGAYPIQPSPPADSVLVRTLAAGRGPVLEIPTMQPDADARALFRAIFHRRPLLNGYSSYFPSGTLERLKRIQRLPDRLTLALLQVETGLTTIVVHTAELDARTRGAWDAIWRAPATRPDLRPVVADDGVLVFDVPGHGT